MPWSRTWVVSHWDLEAVVAHPACAAGDVERDHDPVALGDVLDVATNLLDHAHRLVAEHVTGIDERSEHLVEVKVGPADAGGCDPD